MLIVVISGINKKHNLMLKIDDYAMIGLILAYRNISAIKLLKKINIILNFGFKICRIMIYYV